MTSTKCVSLRKLEVVKYSLGDIYRGEISTLLTTGLRCIERIPVLRFLLFAGIRGKESLLPPGKITRVNELQKALSSRDGCLNNILFRSYSVIKPLVTSRPLPLLSLLL